MLREAWWVKVVTEHEVRVRDAASFTGCQNCLAFSSASLEGGGEREGGREGGRGGREGGEGGREKGREGEGGRKGRKGGRGGREGGREGESTSCQAHPTSVPHC